MSGRDRQAFQFGGDHSVIARGGSENLARQFQPCGQTGIAAGFELRCNTLIVRGVGNHRDAFPILCGGAQHGRSADIDIFHQLFGGQVRLRRGRFERIQIHDNQVDCRDAMLFRLFLILRQIAAIEQPAVNLRVQRLDAAAQHFRPSGKFRHVFDGHSGFAQQLCGAAGGKDFDMQRGKTFCNLQNSSFIEYADQCALHRHVEILPLR